MTLQALPCPHRPPPQTAPAAAGTPQRIQGSLSAKTIPTGAGQAVIRRKMLVVLHGKMIIVL